MKAGETIVLGAQGPQKQITDIRELSSAEASRALRDIFALNAYRYGNPLFEIVRQNKAEFDAAIATLISMGKGPVRERHLREAIPRFNRLVINFVTSFRMYTDHYDLLMSERYGSDSKEAGTWKARCRTSYDGSFGYRFLYRLRNYALHKALPVGEIVFGESEYEPSDLSTRIMKDAGLHRQLLLAFRTQELLDGSDHWSSVRAEIAKRAPLIEVESTISDCFKTLTGLHEFVEQQESFRLGNHAQGLVGLVREVAAKRPGYAPGLLARAPAEPNARAVAKPGSFILSLQILPIPTDLMQQFM